MTESEERDFFSLSTRKIGVEGAIKRVSDDEAGAVVVFIGAVRKSSRGRVVRHLEYESYKEMALREFQGIAEGIRRQWSVRKIAIFHRTGKLQIGEVSVLIAVASAHRNEAYEASRYAIERLKQSAPIWKKEVWDGGEEWIQGA
ncbi:MAG: molybdenum cofactor biosynthesis protein MoaE [Deltaproteobacteria bacterium]